MRIHTIIPARHRRSRRQPPNRYCVFTTVKTVVWPGYGASLEPAGARAIASSKPRRAAALPGDNCSAWR